MQRRLTVALVGVALASMVLIGAGVLILAQIGARQQTEAEAIERLDFLAELVDPNVDADPPRPVRGNPLARAIPVLGLSEAELAVVDDTGVLRTLRAVDAERRTGPGLEPDGRVLVLTDEQLDALANGDVVVLDGTGSEVRVLRAVADDGSPATNDGGGTVALVVSRPVVTISREARLWFVASGAIVLAGSLGASWLLARRFAGPIRRIEQATAAVAAGDFSARVELDGNDELAELGRSVNRMTADLERSKALDQQFLLSISHDLRTPLTAIAGYAEALSDGAITDPARTGVVIANHADRLERLVGDLLDLARLDANQFRLHL
ncbi:MAG: HAMP domain-containing protein, partial [Acidimicrobiia bacterium]|nr:HAMP domain-containing protein [Acidimicrobiia bacterium]